jgi:hypothetical protein
MSDSGRVKGVEREGHGKGRMPLTIIIIPNKASICFGFLEYYGYSAFKDCSSSEENL